VAATAEQEYDRATAHFEEALALAPSVDDPRSATALASAALANHGVAARGQGRLAAAAADHEAALAGQREVGFVRAEAQSLLDLGEVARERGDLPRAIASQREGLMLAWEHGETRVVVEALEGIASTAVQAERAATAARLFAAAERLRELTGLMQRFPVDHTTYERAVAAARVELGEQQFQRNWSEGRGLPLATAIAEVQSLAPSAEDGAEDGPDSTLSPRQVEILQFLAAGKTDRQIAAMLFISVRTVERHVGAILARLGVPTRTAAVVAAIAAGLVPSPDAPPPAPPR
jgi:DNA-binding CsgD family transcriptional regulator